MKILTERQYAEAINEAINRFSEKREAKDYVDARMREAEESIRNIWGTIDEQRRRIEVLEELFLRKPEKEKSSRFSEAVTVPLVVREDEL